MLDSRKYILRQTLLLFIGIMVCVAVMLGVFALLDKFTLKVLWGGLAGAALATANFFFMAVGATMAADKAVQDDVAGGKAAVKNSFRIRILGMFAILFALAKSGLCNPIAMIVPLVLVRPIITLIEFFRKSGEAKK